jgi:hypothetical protein
MFRPLSFAARAGILWTLLSVAGATAYATPVNYGDSYSQPPRWPKGVLKVYVQPDPKRQGRDTLVKEGIDRWKQPLADRGITLEVVIGNPPADAVKPNRYTWEEDDFTEGGKTLGTENDGIAGATPTPTGANKGELTTGVARLRNALRANGDDEKDYLKNLAEHEFAHILGIDDDPRGTVTNHNQDATPRGLNEFDLKELNSIYGTKQTGGLQVPHGTVEQFAGGVQDGFWDYRFTLITANLVPSFDDPEHVSLITFALDTSLVSALLLPPGWIGLIGNGVISPLDPFFTEGHMIDAFTDPAPWSDTDPMTYVAMRTSVAQAARDGLPPGFDPALTLTNPTLVFRLLTTGPLTEGPIQVWADGELQTVRGR